MHRSLCEWTSQVGSVLLSFLIPLLPLSTSFCAFVKRSLFHRTFRAYFTCVSVMNHQCFMDKSTNSNINLGHRCLHCLKWSHNKCCFFWNTWPLLPCQAINLHPIGMTLVFIFPLFLLPRNGSPILSMRAPMRIARLDFKRGRLNDRKEGEHLWLISCNIPRRRDPSCRNFGQWRIGRSLLLFQSSSFFWKKCQKPRPPHWSAHERTASRKTRATTWAVLGHTAKHRGKC